MAEASAYKEYLAGLAAGIATVVVGHPFDTVKVKLQKHNTEAHGIKYRNALHCTSRILKNEGVKGLYRGATSSFVGMAVEGSLFFGIYSQTKQSLQGEVRSSRPQIQVIIPAAAYAGAIISFVLCPSELVKCRMQVQGTDSLVLKHDRYSSPLDCAVKTIKTEGVKGIFRGGFATLLRESIGNSAFFCTYEYSRYYLRSQLNSISSEHIALPTAFSDIGIGIISGGLGGAAFWSTVLPLDVAKTVIQTSPDASRNPFQILSSIYRIAGFRGCYAGLNPTLARAFPANAAAIVAWEFSAKMLGIKRD
ncbi:mitochondrial arginine transporter BAC1 isoform X1 [Macadamia integrifolia]|uniref:mitochondrial arginine transporter BAC1 isoform X1 n=1 Tax=Macadamia integrifolia TaxID=60698 RepID=UPI001C531FE9|nr:mitochondrial arginine transporter BAC1 isoform X1 [Macadamia integrifolia]